MCRFAYGPADAAATHCLLLQYRLTRVVPDKGPLNGCVCVRVPQIRQPSAESGRSSRESWPTPRVRWARASVQSFRAEWLEWAATLGPAEREWCRQHYHRRWATTGSHRDMTEEPGTSREHRETLDVSTSSSTLRCKFTSTLTIMSDFDDSTHTHQSSFFTGRMPFLPPNQQRRSTEGTSKYNACKKKKFSPEQKL